MNIVSLLSYVKKPLSKVEAFLINFEKDLCTLVPNTPNISFQLSSGKKLRAALLLVCAGENMNKPHIIRLASIMELLHYASLIHDDILDDEEERRGELPIYKVISPKLSLLLGDYILTKAFEYLPDENHRTNSKILLNLVAEMCLGEFSQQALIDTNSLNREAYTHVITQKTANFFAKACHIGCSFNPQFSHLIIELEQFGLNYGIAFQILDDVLEILDHLKEGSSSRKFDFIDGINTLPYILFHDKIVETKNTELLTLFEKAKESPNSLLILHQAMGEQGIFGLIQNELELSLTSALKALTPIKKTPSYALLSKATELLLDKAKPLLAYQNE
jgi:geranylgeranyl pyrophosphate synthase